MAAKAFDVKVNEFSIFMGPRIAHWGKGETTYSLRTIPIGGYCAMEGEDGESRDPRSFQAKAPWKRIIILAAGPLMNFITGFLLVVIIFSFVSGFRTLEVTDFVDGCPLESEEGLQKGDIIYEIDGKRLYIYTDFSLLMSRVGEGETDVTVLRNGEKVDLYLNMVRQDYTVNGETEHIFGLILGGTEEKTAGNLIRNAWYTSIDFVRMVWMGLEDLVTGNAGLKDMSGPVGIVSTIEETGQSAETTAEGVLNVLYFCAFIAVNLAVMNLLPIPALDGGHIFTLLVTMLITAISHKKVDPKYEAYIHAAGLVLLLGLMAVVTVNDIARMVTGG